jgi:hypothetical protein
VVNTAINNQFATNEPAPVAPTVSEEVTEAVNPVTETTPVVTTPTEPTFVQEFAYAIPVSDPNGVTDLGTSYVGVGEVINQTFIAGPVSADNDGAIQFIVKNFGTKTSRDWSFSVTLPSGGTYESPTQEPLKPNERAVLTIGFPAGGDDSHTFAVSVDESSDRNSRNDSFSQSVAFAQ